MLVDVRAAIAAMEQALAHRQQFDPVRERRQFRICLTDISEVVLLPRLLNHLSVEHWHERYHADPASRWLRHTVSGLFME